MPIKKTGHLFTAAGSETAAVALLRSDSTVVLADSARSASVCMDMGSLMDARMMADETNCIEGMVASDARFAASAWAANDASDSLLDGMRITAKDDRGTSNGRLITDGRLLPVLSVFECRRFTGDRTGSLE